jgi:hypothetical protein
MRQNLHIDNKLADLLNEAHRAYNKDLYMSEEYNRNINNKYIREYFDGRLKRPLGKDELSKDIEPDKKFILHSIMFGNITTDYLDKILISLDEDGIKFVSDYLFYSCNVLCFYSDFAKYRTDEDMSYIFIGFNFSSAAAAQALLTNGISEKFKQYIRELYKQTSLNNELLYTLFNLSDDVSYITHDIIENSSESRLYHIFINGLNNDFIINEFVYGNSKVANDYVHNMKISTLISAITYMKDCKAVIELMTYYINNREDDLMPFISTILNQLSDETVINELKPLFVLCSLKGNS